jgi:hypothetical protein
MEVYHGRERKEVLITQKTYRPFIICSHESNEHFLGMFSTTHKPAYPALHPFSRHRDPPFFMLV